MNFCDILLSSRDSNALHRILYFILSFNEAKIYELLLGFFGIYNAIGGNFRKEIYSKCLSVTNNPRHVWEKCLRINDLKENLRIFTKIPGRKINRKECYKQLQHAVPKLKDDSSC